jgi:hypothetical protein
MNVKCGTYGYLQNVIIANRYSAACPLIEIMNIKPKTTRLVSETKQYHLELGLKLQ